MIFSELTVGKNSQVTIQILGNLALLEVVALNERALDFVARGSLVVSEAAEEAPLQRADRIAQLRTHSKRPAEQEDVPLVGAHFDGDYGVNPLAVKDVQSGRTLTA